MDERKTIYLDDALKAIRKLPNAGIHWLVSAEAVFDALLKLPPTQSFHNITMNDVLKYIDGMPEDVWQEFTACLECRGWELQRRTASRKENR